MQAEVERPFTYLLARCPSSCQQLTYSEVRLTDIQKWNNTDFVVENIPVKDNVRFFKGNLDMKFAGTNIRAEKTYYH